MGPVSLDVGGRQVEVTHPDKVIFPGHDGRPGRLSTVGKRALLANVVVPCHVVPGAFATSLARAFFTCAPGDDYPRCPPRDNSVGDSCRV